MKKFNFNLESVLNYRLIMEQQAKEKFGQAKIYATKQEALAALPKNVTPRTGKHS